MKIKFYATGGTIDKVYFDARSEYQIGKPQVEEILKDSNVAFEYEVDSVLQKDSLEMTETDRAIIRQTIEEEACLRIVVTHGTDTMIATAKSLLGIEKKTIVLTGAMEPARSRYTDAIFNVGCAIGAVQNLAAGEAMGHEMMEAYSSAVNPKGSYDQAHADASQFFPAPKLGNGVPLLGENLLPKQSGFTQTWQWARGSSKGVTVTYKFDTPIPLASVTRQPPGHITQIKKNK